MGTRADAVMRRVTRDGLRSVLLAALVVVGLAACGPSSPSRERVEVVAGPTAPGSLITVIGGIVQERSSRTGEPIATLARHVSSAAETADGTMLYTSRSGCHSSITEVTRTKKITELLTLKNAVSDMSVSRDGAWIGYLTYDRCPTHRCLGTRCAGAAGYGPNVVVVMNAATMHATRPTTKSGSGIDAVAFSPDGRRFAMSLNDAILTMPTTNPDLEDAARLSPPQGCTYGQPAWTTDGIDAGESCGSGRSPAMPTRLAHLDPTSPQSTRAAPPIALPKCIDGFIVAVNPSNDTLLTTATTGYGDGNCAGDPVTHIAAREDRHLTDLLRTSPGDGPRLAATDKDADAADDRDHGPRKQKPPTPTQRSQIHGASVPRSTSRRAGTRTASTRRPVRRGGSGEQGQPSASGARGVVDQVELVRRFHAGEQFSQGNA